MHYHIILTEKCNMNCRYCYEKSMQEFDNGLGEKFKFNFQEPCVSNVDTARLKNFLSKDKEAIKKKIVSEKDFEYEKYFGPEIIP